MKTIGLFEAKTKLSEICQLVFQTGQSVRITRRGRPLAVISPPAPIGRRESVWDARLRFEKEHGRLTDDFELPLRKLYKRTLQNPLD